MFCTHCGKEIEDGVAACPYCGARQSVANPQNNGFGEAYAPAPSEKKKNKLGIAGFAISMASIVLGWLVAVPLVGFIISCIAVARRKSFNVGNKLAVAGLVVNIVLMIVWLIVDIYVGAPLLVLLLIIFGLQNA